MAATATIKTYSDADFRRTFVLQTAGETPYDLTGATFQMKLRKRVESHTVPISLSTDSGITIIDAVNGQFEIAITQAQLEALEPDTYVHSLIMTLGGLKTLIWVGTIEHSAGASR